MKLMLLWTWFLARFHLSDSAVCEMSKGLPARADYHDYQDDVPVGEEGDFTPPLRPGAAGRGFVMTTEQEKALQRLEYLRGPGFLHPFPDSEITVVTKLCRSLQAELVETRAMLATVAQDDDRGLVELGRRLERQEILEWVARQRAKISESMTTFGDRRDWDECKRLLDAMDDALRSFERLLGVQPAEVPTEEVED